MATKSKHPYYKIEVRMDRITKVPAFAKNYVSVGELVERHNDKTVWVHNSKYEGFLRIGESYSKFDSYSSKIRGRI